MRCSDGAWYVRLIENAEQDTIFIDVLMLVLDDSTYGADDGVPMKLSISFLCFIMQPK